MNRTYKLLAAAAVFMLAAPLVIGMAMGAASDAPPAATPDTVQAMPQNNMSGWTIPMPAQMPGDPNQAAQIKRGAYLVTAGDCLPCHSVSGQPPFAGGNAVGSPVGAVYTPNITSSKRYGIGNYTDQQFYNVLHNGIAPGSSLLVFPHYLLPSMPYDAYSKLSYPDVMAIKAYLMALPPAEIPNRVGQIPFPFDIRAALLGWRIFFFHPQEIQYNPAWSPQVRNGAYLVQALAHCSDCHTPRNILFGSEMDKFLGGGHILAQSWYAPNITSDKTVGVGGWDPKILAQYLHGGGSLGPGSPVGPMQEVVGDSLSRLPASDVEDIAAYLQTGVPAQPAAAPPANDTASIARGHEVYDANCARCHGANGEGVNNNFPNLAANQAFWNGPAYNIIGMVLGGFAPWHEGQSNMPAFRATLSDSDIAAVSNYVRTSWGNKGAADATGDMVASLRATAATQVTLAPGVASAALGDGPAAAQLTDVSGAFSRDGDQLNCTIDGQFNGAGAGVHLAGSCFDMGTTLRGVATENGKTVPFTLKVQPVRDGQVSTGVTLYGPVGGQNFIAHISYITPNE
jgi:mono/diheme cytochrome c family protein